MVANTFFEKLLRRVSATSSFFPPTVQWLEHRLVYIVTCFLMPEKIQTHIFYITGYKSLWVPVHEPAGAQ